MKQTVLADRVRQAREDKGLSQSALAKRAGITQQSVADIERGKVERPRKLNELARALGVNADWLVGISRTRDLVSPSGRDIVAVRITGEAAAGTWREAEVLQDIEIEPEADFIPSVSREPYKGMMQYALKVTRGSMDKIVRDGEYAICVPYFEARRVVKDGDIVHVERRRGDVVETTLKRVKAIGSKIELVPESAEPGRYKSFVLGAEDTVEGLPGETIAIVGLVIASHRPLA